MPESILHDATQFKNIVRLMPVCPDTILVMSGPVPESDSSHLLLRKEQEFHENPPRSFTMVRRAISRATSPLSRWRDVTGFYDPRGKVVLDFGCGSGGLVRDAVLRGATIAWAFDLSARRVAEAKALTEDIPFSAGVGFLVTDGHTTPFKENAFDLIIGSAILHHMDLGKALPELRRILSVNGKAIFVEPLSQNPLLRLGRLLLPWARTDDEHPLRESDWGKFRRIFPRFQHYDREVLSTFLLPLIWLLPKRLSARLAEPIRRADDWIIRHFPSVGRYGRISILVLE